MMFSWTLFKTTLKKNFSLFLIFLCVLTLYMTIMIFMYDPEEMEAIMAMLDLFPQDLMTAMGFSSLITDLTSYLASWLYGLLMIAFPMVYSIILSNRLVAKMVDNSSFACLLSTPNKRTSIIATQGLFALLSLSLILALIFALGVALSAVLYPDALNATAFLRLNVTTLLVNLAVIMISFFCSCLFNDTRKAIGFGAGIPITFLLMNMLGNTSEQASVLKNISIYGFYDPVELVQSSNSSWVNLTYLALILALFAAALIVFKRKQLPL